MLHTVYCTFNVLHTEEMLKIIFSNQLSVQLSIIYHYVSNRRSGGPIWYDIWLKYQLQYLTTSLIWGKYSSTAGILPLYCMQWLTEYMETIIFSKNCVVAVWKKVSDYKATQSVIVLYWRVLNGCFIGQIWGPFRLFRVIIYSPFVIFISFDLLDLLPCWQYLGLWLFLYPQFWLTTI